MEQKEYSRYAKAYDNLLKFKPSYHELLDYTIESLIRVMPQKNNCYKIAEFGGGTGNLTQKIATTYSNSQIYSIELNNSFLEILKNKTKKYNNINLIKADIEKNIFSNNSLDSIVMIHVLRLTQNADKGYAIKRAYEQLKPNGYFIIADIGRKLDMKKHGKEIFTAAYKEYGLKNFFKIINLFYNNLNSIKFNKKCSKREIEKPKHMLHTLDEFSLKIQKFGFKIIEARDDLYLGDDDFIIAQK
jgi:ubiquinone/menaquinone biosynthesis C-methylase UbiE